ncbi:type I-E CRISPR-associated protein Cas5/CasD [Streptomyces clavuligerus]|uniref:type I-E CRISPR-associated protein Cas5/CasD n=1 Tax=Streptomyces clavuligerus TaxID=1901 RepID=UPI00020D926E|nr:type I-E CRISPR-associated protein Cas5/CasD [Streptomyces clavuligerus]
MITVLLHLAGPLQTWGATSRWDEHTTLTRPTKSGITGLVAAALGRERADPLDDLTALVFAVRCDRPGHLTADFHTAGGGSFGPPPPQHAHRTGLDPDRWYGAPRHPTLTPAAERGTPPWRPEDRTAVLTRRHYLADAAFLAGLSTPDHHLAHRIAHALTHPARLLCLGRRSCPPAQPLHHSTTRHGPRTWPDRIPLLPSATTPTPLVWTETPPGPGTTAHAEQTPTTHQMRDHPLMHLTSRHTTPPTPGDTP